MELARKPFQGTLNVIRFNWHFYLLSLGLLTVLLTLSPFVTFGLRIPLFIVAVLILTPMLISLGVTYYVYDLSKLYEFPWLMSTPLVKRPKVLNINAGFDETSELLQAKLDNPSLTICDFYDPKKHTEASIRRARKAYPPNSKTVPVKTEALPFADEAFDYVFAIFSAHEIRDLKEREVFFAELARVTKAEGRLYVTEHLRDLSNFLAYNIGFFHFHTKSSWLAIFRKTGLKLQNHLKTTPFVTTFTLCKNGTAL